MPKEDILLGISPERLADIARSEFGTDKIEFGTPPTAIDRRAVQIAGLLRDELGRGERSSQLYIDALLTVMSIHILRYYSNIGEASGRLERRLARGGLTQRAWRLVRDHLHNRYAEPLTARELAAVAGLSPSHFRRAFRDTTGLPPHRYLRNLRVRKAEQMAATTDLPLKAIAQATGFSSPSHMIASMRELRCVTPGKIRRARLAAVSARKP